MSQQIHPRNNLTNRYPLFQELVGSPSGLSVLDFGGNSGNLLMFSKGAISEDLYHCLDVSKLAIEVGQAEFPKAHWYHYDRYNWVYNHEGQLNPKFPELSGPIDIVWAYSVFSHTDYDELLRSLTWMMGLQPKRLMLSLLDLKRWEMKEYFYNQRIKEYGSSVDIKSRSSENIKIMYFGDNDHILENSRQMEKKDFNHFLAFYDLDWLLDELSLVFEGKLFQIKRPGDGYIPFLTYAEEI